MTRRNFIEQAAAAAVLAPGGALCAGGAVADWKPSARWRGFNILGMFRCPTTGLAPDPRVDGFFPEWEFKALRDWGFNFARLPLDYRILVRDDSWTNLDERQLKKLDEAVAFGRRYGIHVQIALHRIPGYCILDQTEAFPLGTSPVAQAAARGGRAGQRLGRAAVKSLCIIKERPVAAGAHICDYRRDRRLDEVEVLVLRDADRLRACRASHRNRRSKRDNHHLALLILTKLTAHMPSARSPARAAPIHLSVTVRW